MLEGTKWAWGKSCIFEQTYNLLYLLSYSENQYSLPRWEDLSVSRATMYDDSYTRTPTQSWMLLPLVDYHAGELHIEEVQKYTLDIWNDSYWSK